MDALAAEYGRRWARRAAIRALAFDKQLALLNDRARRKVIKCSRRAGKTMAGGLGILDEMETAPGCAQIVFGLTRESVRRIWWPEVLEWQLDRLKWTYRFNKVELSMTAPNGSVCYFMGADANQREMAKALGQKPRRVIADECGEYTIDLATLVNRRIGPALVDNGGDLWLMGVPGDNIGSEDDPHYFYAATEAGLTWKGDGWESIAAEWSRHTWDTFDNPHMREKWGAHLTEKLRLYPNFKETAEYIIEYTGQWFVDPSKLVYHYKPAANDIEAMPPGDEGWTYVLGVDLGWNNATAFALSCYRPHDHHLYFTRAYKRAGIDLDQTAAEIRALIAGKQRCSIVVDGAAKQAVMELRKRVDLPLKPTDKTDKGSFVRMMNTDLVTGRIKVLKGACSDLVIEWANLKRDVRAKMWKELESDSNDATDAALYAWRHARNYLAKPADPPLSTDPEDVMERHWERQAEETRERADEDRRDRGGMFD